MSAISPGGSAEVVDAEHTQSYSASGTSQCIIGAYTP